MTSKTTKQFEMPEVAPVFTGSYPKGYRPWPKGWSFPVERMRETLEDGTLKMLTMDICISEDGYVKRVNEGIQDVQESLREKVLTRRAEEKYDCEIGCQHCFECKTMTENPLMTTQEVFEMLLEAKKLGLEAVKFLGPGELLHNPKLFEILDFLRTNNIHIGIFTKGLVLGSDEYAQKFFGITAKELCAKIAEYENITILLSLTSADYETENARINSGKVPDLFNIRNKGFENMASMGMNADPENQRLTLLCTPVLKDNIDEALAIYKWAIERNIPVVLAPTMVSGKGMDMAEVKDSNFKEEQLTELYVKIYTWLIRERIMTVGQIEEEGVAPYPGFACNQFISGMMIRKDGRVQACPGNESEKFVYGKNIRSEDMKTAWKRSLGYKLRCKLIFEGELTLTQPCYAKSEGIKTPEGELVKKGCGSIPAGFYKRVLEKIKETR
jgi:MoaA/NifB/PqqE/SkfB family radical SAM enzyme